MAAAGVVLLTVISFRAEAWAVPSGSVLDFGPGVAASSLVVQWSTGDTDPLVIIGIAKAAAFSPSSPCDYNEWTGAAADPINQVGYFY